MPSSNPSPDPRGGHQGALYLAPAAGQALVQVTGMQDATYTRGQTFAAAHGMDAAHGFKVTTKSDPSIKGKNIHDFAKTTVMKALIATEAGVGVPFAWYPRGNDASVTALSDGVAGTCFVQADTSNGLTDAIMNDINLWPARPDWNPFGDWDPA